MSHPSVYVAIILGGFVGPDGYVTSPGLVQLKPALERQFGAKVEIFQWGDYESAAAALRANRGSRTIALGYSGGGSRVTWMLNHKRPPRIDFAVLYDPSPKWQMLPLRRIRAVCYHNTNPMFLGLGGGVCRGPRVKSIDIAENHALVQVDQRLHKRTLRLIRRFLRSK